MFRLCSTPVMDSYDSRIAHSPEASTDERASPLPPPEAPPRAPGLSETLSADIVPAPGRFATRAEEEAYWIGVRVGTEAAKKGSALPPHPHIPADPDLDITRGPGEPGLLSGRLAQGTGTGPAGRKLRHDGWTAEKVRVFLVTLAATGVVADACRACGMSRDAAYERRNSTAGRAFALAWEAALALARPAMADELASRARHGTIERVYRNGELVAERHRHDNRLAMAVLTRLDRQVEELAERAPAVRAVANEFEQFLDLLPRGNEAAEAFLTPRLCRGPVEPPHFRDAGHAQDSEPALLARAAFRERHGVGLPSDVATGDLDVKQMESWTDDQLGRAQASGLLASLDDDEWPQSAFAGGADGTDGMCKFRKLYLRLNPDDPEDYSFGED
jgi:hypothetical protein